MRSRKRALRPGPGQSGAPPRASAAQELAQAGLRAAVGGTEAAGTPRRRTDDSPDRSRAGSRLGYYVRVPSSGTKRRAVN